MVDIKFLLRLLSCLRADARSLATSYDSKYVEVSAALGHNVDTLLVGIVKQIRLNQQGVRSNKIYTR